MAAGVFYFTNPNQEIVGNAASGGWAGFLFPNLPAPLKDQRAVQMVPKDRPLKKFKGNSAHSTGYWWNSAAGIYVGGNLKTKDSATGLTTYTHGREVSRDSKDDSGKQIWLRFEDTKVFLANRGMQNWGNRQEVIRFEGHDLGLSANVFGSVWIDDMLHNCRSNNQVTWFNGCPTSGTSSIPWGKCNIRDFTHHQVAMGFQFYDVSMRHIITNSKFRNCNTKFAQCTQCKSSVWQLLTHSDQFVPDHMQTTRNIMYENCDMSTLIDFSVKLPIDSISGRLQNWEDLDGSVTNVVKTGKRTLLGSNRSAQWYKMNSQCTTQNEMWVCPMNSNDGKKKEPFAL
jgi:hypothetical protein